MTDPLESAWGQLQDIYRSGKERSQRRHRVVCGTCGEDVLIVWETDPLVFRTSQRRGFEFHTPDMPAPKPFPDLEDVIADSGLTETEFFERSAADFDAFVAEYGEKMWPEYLLNKRSKAWDRPRLCEELISGAMRGSFIDLTCRCARPVPVSLAQLVVDIETRRDKRTVRQT